MSEKESIRLSKFLSHVLRHRPEKLDITLDEQGWADVDFLIRQMNRKGLAVTPEMLQHVVETNNKKRFAFDDNRTKIRANQGHSVAVELCYTAQTPPPMLYHGTSKKHLQAILASGLEKRKRHHVHLSTDVATALQVGRRHGEAVVLCINTAGMHSDGFQFFESENKVWLTEQVPVQYITVLEG
ncbi:RNA 2'-phosphotransferase [Pontibacter diazotrophicus]|uniref:Probable RNA 2'-phosphotransferase n=1 Tax=Pontibacter diazotrophicus TaxID=1400979 RepID=A0A3D8LHF3_9BACT|nr:RNA 2'-phosphotransferase [Pontibacter diazotrophicus]